MMNELNQAGNELNIIVLDACRDNPFGWGRGGGRGLQVVGNQPADSIIVYATGAGAVAADGEGRNGLFTGQLLKHLATPGLEVNEIFRRTMGDVAKASGNKQRPAVYNQFPGLAYLGPRPAASAPAASAAQAPAPAAAKPASTPAPVQTVKPVPAPAAPTQTVKPAPAAVPQQGGLIRTLSGHGGGVISVAWSPDGRRIVSTSYDGTVKVWDVESGRELHTLSGHGNWVNSAAFSPDGRRIVSASGDKTVKVWDTESGPVLHTLSGHRDIVTSAAWSPDGRRVVSASVDKTVKVWDAESGKVLRTLSGHGDFVLSAAFSPDGRRIVSASSDGVKVWDAESGRELRTLLPMPGDISPDGRHFVHAGGGTVIVWDAESGKILRTLSGPGDHVLSAAFSPAFSPDGRRIVSALTDKTMIVWDAD
jgi:dipeptidyl aminopeptidase/acylaminoacyl peptidase